MLSGLLTLLAAAPAASAHATTGQIIMAGRTEVVSIVVNAETDAPMTGVDVLIPRGFDLSSTVPAISGAGQHWPVTRDGKLLRFRGDGIPDGGALYVEVMGRAAGAGMLPFDTVTRAADGTVVSWSGAATSSHPAALVQVVGGAASGAPSRQDTGSTGGRGPGGRVPGAYVAAAVAVLAGLVFAYASRHRLKAPAALPAQAAGTRAERNTTMGR